MWGLKCGFDWIKVPVWFQCGGTDLRGVSEAAIKPVQSCVMQLCLESSAACATQFLRGELLIKKIISIKLHHVNML